MPWIVVIMLILFVVAVIVFTSIKLHCHNELRTMERATWVKLQREKMYKK